MSSDSGKYYKEMVITTGHQRHSKSQSACLNRNFYISSQSKFTKKFLLLLVNEIIVMGCMCCMREGLYSLLFTFCSSSSFIAFELCVKGSNSDLIFTVQILHIVSALFFFLSLLMFSVVNQALVYIKFEFKKILKLLDNN